MFQLAESKPFHFESWHIYLWDSEKLYYKKNCEGSRAGNRWLSIAVVSLKHIRQKEFTLRNCVRGSQFFRITGHGFALFLAQELSCKQLRKRDVSHEVDGDNGGAAAARYHPGDYRPPTQDHRILIGKFVLTLQEVISGQITNEEKELKIERGELGPLQHAKLVPVIPSS
ncbi:hypothetical protein BDZ91DRAFT_762618 [Kalaharituber pfeilii]|nr:hypothetical protein BDZ91DRAFT_762618 [Kalaharituber pfeilii]